MWCSTQKVQGTQNFMKNKMTKRVDILRCKFTFYGSCYFNFNFFLQFSQKCAIVRVYQPFRSFCLLWNSFFSSIVVKFKSYVISKETILIFLVNLPMVNIYKFYKEKMLIQPHGKPQEQHLGDVQPKKFELHKIS